MIYELGDNKWLICTNETIAQINVEERAGVRNGTYAADLVTRLLKRVIEKSVNLKEDYLVYFVPEYKSFQRFIQVRFDFPEGVIIEAEALFANYNYIFLCTYLFSFFEDEKCKPFLKVLFPDGRTA